MEHQDTQIASAPKDSQALIGFRPVQDDYIESKSTALSPGTDEMTAMHEFRISKDFVNISDAMEKGTLIFTIPLDPTIDPTAEEMSKMYEYYSLEDFNVSLDATSPFGTASGAFQAAWITDPQNATIANATPADKNAALGKVIRQEGSKVVRPRESEKMVVKTKGRRFVLTLGDKRLYSFGAIVGILRAAPSAGDIANFAVTVHGRIKFYRGTISSGALVGSSRATITGIKSNGLHTRASKKGVKIEVRTPEKIPSFYVGKIKFNKPLRAIVKGKVNGFTRTAMETWALADAWSLGTEDHGTSYFAFLPFKGLGECSEITDLEILDTPTAFVSNYLAE